MTIEKCIAENSAEPQDAQFQDLFDNAPVAYHELDREGVIQRVNRAECALLGYAAGELVGRKIFDFVVDVEREQSRDSFRGKLCGEKPLKTDERQFRRANGAALWAEVHDTPVRNSAGETVGMRTALLDRTECKRMETYREMERQVLQILNEPGDLQSAIRRVVESLKALTGCDAAGIRLQNGGDFPYFAQEGFCADFMRTENSLLGCVSAGENCRDEAGSIALECVCGAIISGRTDPASSLFTRGGSCWTNDSAEWVNRPLFDRPSHPTRFRCIHLGYGSIALSPIRIRERIIGLIQINHKRKGEFTLAAVELLESVASHIGEALMRKQTEEALKRANRAVAQSERHFRSIFNCVSDAILVFTVGEDGQPSPFLEINDCACRYFGYSREELLALRFHDIVAAEGEANLATVLPALALKSHLLYEASGITRDGRRIPVEVNTHRVDLDGAATLICSLRDIAGRKDAEKQLRDIFEGAIEGIYRTSADGKPLAANPAMAAMLGYASAAELVAESHDPTLQTWLDSAERKSLIARIEERGSVRDHECQLQRKDGVPIWISINGRKVSGADGRTLYYDGFVLDVTERKRAAAEAAQLQLQFQQAQKMESVGLLAGGVAHDFNNLLTVINGYSHMGMSKLNAQDPLRETLREIQKAGERAAALTRQLLAFSRKQVLRPRPLDVNRVVTDVLPMVQRLLGEDVEMRVALNCESAPVYADPHQLEQVLVNLAVNGRDAMPQGGRLSIETGLMDHGLSYPRAQSNGRLGRHVVLAVSDTGVGMDAETQSRIFEPFFTTKAVGEGTGLGLAVVQGVVSQSGGHIEVESEPGRGTVFRIYLPALSGFVASDPGDAAIAAPAGGGETLLLVEDQASVRKYLVEVLQTFGYRVVAAESGVQALELFGRERRVDLVLSDVVMPNMSGRELAGRLEALQPGIKVLFMSGYTGKVIEREQKESAFIQKPFGPEELASRIRALLGAPEATPVTAPLHVLVVDDEVAVRRFLRMVLEEAGYQVSEAGDGKEALRKARAGDVDLTITDLIMPEQEGIETIQSLKREVPGVAVIAISGAFGAQYLKIARMIGADAVLAKPVMADLLIETVSAVLRTRQGH